MTGQETGVKGWWMAPSKVGFCADPSMTGQETGVKGWWMATSKDRFKNKFRKFGDC